MRHSYKNQTSLVGRCCPIFRPSFTYMNSPPDDGRECATASALEADILLRLFAENLLKQSGEIPADTTQILMHGLSAITVAKAARLQEKEHLLPIAEDEKQNMIVDQPPNLQTSTSCSLAQSNFAPKTSDNTHEHDSDDLPTARMPFPGDLETALGQTGVTRHLLPYRSAHSYVAFNLGTHETPPRARKERPHELHHHRFARVDVCAEPWAHERWTSGFHHPRASSAASI